LPIILDFLPELLANIKPIILDLQKVYKTTSCLIKVSLHNNMDRSIVHMDLDSFFVAVECLKDASLRGKPVIVGSNKDRGVVAACSYEARKFGVHSAMPGRMAKQLCPDAIFVRGDFEAYSRYSDLVTELVQTEAPLVEKASIDEFYIDLSGMERYMGCYQWALRVKRQIYTELGLHVSVALSPNKTVSKVAVGEAKPNGQIFVPHGMEKTFLQPLRIEKMPMIGEKTTHLLRTMGVQTVGKLAEIPLKVLERVFGKNGSWMWERANGIDNSSVVPYHAQKSMSKESTFEKDTADVSFLRQEIIRMVGELTFDLRKMKETTGCITIKIRYADFDTQTKQISIPYTASDHVLRRYAMELFEKLFNRRLMIRLIGVRLSKLVSGGMQLNLFDNSAAMSPLYVAMDKIRIRYGLSSVQPASTITLKRSIQSIEYQKYKTLNKNGK
jgi:DNA polymerase-4